MIKEIKQIIEKKGIVSVNELSRELNIDKEFLLYIIRIIEQQSDYKIHLLNSHIIDSKKCANCPLVNK